MTSITVSFSNSPEDFADAAQRSKNWDIDGFSDNIGDGECTHLDLYDGDRAVAKGIRSQADAEVLSLALIALRIVAGER